MNLIKLNIIKILTKKIKRIKLKLVLFLLKKRVKT
jgi:hypothetical protein